MQHQLKYYLIFIIFLGLGLNAFARKKSKDVSVQPAHKNSVSFNVLEPVLKVLSKNTSIDSSFNIKAPIVYYGRETPKKLFRIGARVAMKNKLNESDLFSDKKEERLNKYDLTFSLLRLKEVTRKVKIGYGPCVSTFVLFDKKIFDSGFDKVTFKSDSWSATAGVNFLVKYAISDRLSIYSEYLLNYQFVKTYVGKEFSALPEQNYANEKSTQHGFQFEYPISLYLSYHF